MGNELSTLLSAAIAFHTEGRLDDAMVCYGAALEMDPRNTLALYNAGCIFEEVGYHREAAHCFQTAQKICVTDGVKDSEVIKAAEDYVGEVN